MMVVTSRKQSIFNITNDFLFSFIWDFFRAYEIQEFKHFFFPFGSGMQSQRDINICYLF